ncbi:transcriptional regulator [Paractinoplanes abujensis]|uniref:AcrR family transcriptional regulator n=1 Tax=Paractinoplanes abujensis TaxID=882441 RepID=A0A7W7D2K4_9ACTN|nr:TetR/AcrR family transcriptional regulator [Actinoplanes abujensis]MBB4697641.1 AcrR family transcriptional regulator [Actinoplanes abujensis]GID19870.1 transcriptional regulator [Actinoplanes abujensis]
MLYGVQTPRRRDAQRNREAIVRAACDLMTSERAVVGMPEIARRAGVGQATLYRHFPDRYALTAAVIGLQVERLEACVAATRQQPAAFRAMLDAVLRAQVSMRPLVRLARRLEPAVQGRYLRRIVALLAEPLRRAQEHGHVRSDLEPGDLVLIFTMVEGVLAGTLDGEAEARAAADRTIDLALDGVFKA